MLRIFKSEPALGDKLAGRRNWCEVWEASSSIPARNQPLLEYQVAAQGSLVFTLRLEVCVESNPLPPPRHVFLSCWSTESLPLAHGSWVADFVSQWRGFYVGFGDFTSEWFGDADADG